MAASTTGRHNRPQQMNCYNVTMQSGHEYYGLYANTKLEAMQEAELIAATRHGTIDVAVNAYSVEAWARVN